MDSEIEDRRIKESHSIALGYAWFGLMWIAMIVALVIYVIRIYGISHPMVVLETLQASSGAIIYLVGMSSVNIIMALAVWKIISLPSRVQRLVLRFAFFLAAGAAILLLSAIVSWFFKKMPVWYSPLYNVFPAALLTFGYGYYAYSLRKLMRISGNELKTDAQ